MSKKYTAKDLYMQFNVVYTLEDDRNTFLSFDVIAKSIDKALEKAKRKLNYEILKDNQMPIITSIEFNSLWSSKITFSLQITGFLYLPNGTLNFPIEFTRYNPLKHV